MKSELVKLIEEQRKENEVGICTICILLTNYLFMHKHTAHIYTYVASYILSLLVISRCNKRSGLRNVTRHLDICGRSSKKDIV